MTALTKMKVQKDNLNNNGGSEKDKKNSKIIEFIATPSKVLYNSEDYKIYACEIDSFAFPNITVGDYGTITIKGNMPELCLDAEYEIKSVEKSDKYGTSYEVKNIKRKRPTSLSATRNFLYEILTQKQTDTLLSVYPDIVNRIIENRIQDIDLSKTKGIKDYTFNVIKRKVIENFKLADIVEEFQGLLSLSVVKKLYNKYNSVEMIKEKVKQDPYKCLCGLEGIGFKTADSILLMLEDSIKKNNSNSNNNTDNDNKDSKPLSFMFEYDLRTSYQRAKACVDYILSENENNGNTYMDYEDVKNAIATHTPEAKDHLETILTKSEDVIFDNNSLRVCRRTAYETEKYIAEKVKEGMSINTVWNCDCSKYTSLNGFSLTKDQCKTSQYMCQHNLALLVGYGGSGKSSSTRAFINMLKDNYKSFLLLAPTGKAAKVLSAFADEIAQTIHRGLGYMPPNQWTYNEDYKLPYDVVIVDEFSMVDIFLMKHLLEAIDFNKTKLLLIGDDAQIPSVGAGNILFDLLKYNKIPTITLDKIFRYGEGGLSTVATNTRQGIPYLQDAVNGIQSFGNDKSYSFIPITQERLVDYVAKLYKALIKDKGYSIEDVVILSSYNVGQYGTIEINKRIQDEINHDASAKMTFGDSEYRLNDIVMNVVNDYKAILYNEKINYNDGEDIEENISKELADKTFVANGETGRVIKILRKGMVIDYDGMLIYCPKASLKNIKLAYAISTHKSQGAQFKIVILITPKAHTYFLNSNLLYVGESRAKEACYHLGDIKTVNIALKKKANFDRKTLLVDFLNNKIS